MTHYTQMLYAALEKRRERLATALGDHQVVVDLALLHPRRAAPSSLLSLGTLCDAK